VLSLTNGTTRSSFGVVLKQVTFFDQADTSAATYKNIKELEGEEGELGEIES